MRTIDLQAINDQRYIINFEGYIDSEDDINHLNEIFDSLEKTEPEIIVLNFDNAKYINSAILGAMMKYYKGLTTAKIYIYCNNPYIRDLFKITSLDKFFEYLESITEIDYL